MTPDYNRLRVFYLVMAKGGVGVAAKQLHVTQSAVSQHLLKLEDELKTPLFTRLQNRLVPTPAGDRLFEVMAPFVKQLDDTLALLDRAREAPFGLLRIGAPVEFGVHYLPAFFAAFRKMYANVSFALALGHPEQLIPMLEKGELDLAFADMFSSRPERHSKHAILDIAPVMDETLVLVAQADYHRTAMNAGRGVEALLRAQYVAYQENAAAIKGWFKYHFNKVPNHLDIAVTVESVQAVVAAINAGLGLGVVPLHVVSDSIARGELIPFGRRKKALCNKISLVRLLDKHPTPAEKRFIEYVKGEMNIV